MATGAQADAVTVPPGEDPTVPAKLAANIAAFAEAFAAGRSDVRPDVDDPGFDAAWSAMTPLVAGIVGGPARAILLETRIKGDAMGRRFRVETDGGSMDVDATLFSIAVSGIADCVADVIGDAEAIATISRSLRARGVCHPRGIVAVASVPVTPMGAALIGAHAIHALARALFGAMMVDLAPDEEGPLARGIEGLDAVRRAFAGHVQWPNAPELEADALTSRILVGMRILPLCADEERRDFFTEFAGDAEIAGDGERHDPHEVWHEAMLREFADRGVHLDVPTTFTEAASVCAANTVHDFIVAIEERTGWPMVEACRAVHVHRDALMTTAHFERNGVVYGPLRLPTVAVAYDPDIFDEALETALEVGGERREHDALEDLPAPSPGCGTPQAGGRAQRAGPPPPANDNRGWIRAV